MDTSYQVLFVEDDTQIGSLVKTHLQEAGHRVTWKQDGMQGMEAYHDGAYDLVILDLRLPSMGGLEMCRRIRDDNAFIPLVMLTAKAEKRDVVHGLELGADDYITKPFSPKELVARIRALFRRIDAERDRSNGTSSSDLITIGPLTVDPEKHSVSRDGSSIHLTAKEFDLLLQFARHPGHAFSRTELLEAVWGPEFDGYDHTVNTHINRLRGKIEPDPSSPTYIQTVWGIGYRLVDPE